MNHHSALVSLCSVIYLLFAGSLLPAVNNLSSLSCLRFYWNIITSGGNHQEHHDTIYFNNTYVTLR